MHHSIGNKSCKQGCWTLDAEWEVGVTTLSKDKTVILRKLELMPECVLSCVIWLGIGSAHTIRYQVKSSPYIKLYSLTFHVVEVMLSTLTLQSCYHFHLVCYWCVFIPTHVRKESTFWWSQGLFFLVPTSIFLAPISNTTWPLEALAAMHVVKVVGSRKLLNTGNIP